MNEAFKDNHDRRNAEIRQELRELAPDMAAYDLKKAAGPPEGYFDALPDKVLQKLPAERRSTARIRRMGLAAASIAAAIALAVIIWWPDGQDGSNSLLAEVSADEAYSYVWNNIEDYSSAELLVLMDSENAMNALAEPELQDAEYDELLEILSDDIDESDLNEFYDIEN